MSSNPNDVAHSPEPVSSVYKRGSTNEDYIPDDDVPASSHPTVVCTDLMQLESEIRGALDDSRSVYFARHIDGGFEKPRIGKYLIRKILGERGQAFVIQAFDPDLEREVVVKLYRADLPAGKRERLVKEGRALTKINSPNVVQCYAVEQIQDLPALILEFVPGTTLTGYCRNELAEDEIIRLTKGITRGVEDAHRVGLLHGDLKPDNVLISRDGTARLCDFGLVRNISESRAYEVAGTPPFMPPERSRMEVDQIDARSDVFGIGSILYYMLTGSAPFAADSKEESLELSRLGTYAAPGLPGEMTELENLCDKCLQPSPAERFQNTGEILSALAGLGGLKNGRSDGKLAYVAVGVAIACIAAAWMYFNWQ